MKIEIVRPVWIDGTEHPAGTVIEDAPDALAMELIGMRKAIGHAEPTEPEAKPKRAKKAD